jgi:histidinol-phosphate aminotransferase
VLVSRGSDEAIDLLSRIYLRAGEDAILQFTPTFGMYQVAARIQGAAVIELPLDRARAGPWMWTPCWPRGTQYQAGVPLLAQQSHGNSLMPGGTRAICKALDGKAIVVIDEAYIEWSRTPASRRGWPLSQPWHSCALYPRRMRWPARGSGAHAGTPTSSNWRSG